MTYEQFKSMVLGKAFDFDNYPSYQKYQCWDGYVKFCIENGVPYDHCTVSGYVKDIYNNRNSNNLLKYFNAIYTMQPGDLCFFKETPNWTPYSHVAIFDHDNGDGYGWFLGQNQGGKNGAFNLAKLPYSATFYYAFRLKNIDNSGNQILPVNELIDQILHVGSYVTSIPMKIGDQGLQVKEGALCCYLKELGGWYPISLVEEYDHSDGALDNVLMNTNARVYLTRSRVEKVDIPTNRCKINGIWVNCKPLIEVA